MNGTDKDKGRQKGLDVFENVQDSMILAYLAKNSTTEAKLDFFVDMTRNLSRKKKIDLQRASYGLSSWNNILEKVPFKNNIVLGNLVLLGYIFEINLYDKIDEPNIGQLFSSIQSFFKSDPDLNEFEILLQKSLNKLTFEEVNFSECQFEKYKIQDVNFMNLEFNSCNFKNCRFQNIKFENISFNSCRFNKLEWSTFEHIGVCEYKSCHFYRYNYQNKNGKEQVIYKHSIFEASDLYYENFEGAIFKDCILIDTSFSTNEKIDKDSMDIEFIDCVWKKNGKVEVLNGRNLEIFVETGNDTDKIG